MPLAQWTESSETWIPRFRVDGPLPCGSLRASDRTLNIRVMTDGDVRPPGRVVRVTVAIIVVVAWRGHTSMVVAAPARTFRWVPYRPA